MRRRLIVLVVAAVGVVGLVGCTPSGGESASPEPEVTTPGTSPSPQWTAEEQSAIDAVQRYLEVWTEIGQNIDTADWNTIRDVASDPAANDAGDTWVLWEEHGWHLEGSPSFEVDRVDIGATDYQGTRYHVYGCYITVNVHLADQDGNLVEKQGADRSTGNYLVLHLVDPSDKYLVLEDTSEGNPC